MSAKLRLVALLGSLLAASLAGLPRAEPESWPARCRRIPLVVGGYEGREQKIPGHWRFLLETDDLTLRRYRQSDGVPITLCVVFSSRNRKLVHPPEVCYSGQGYLISDRSVRTLGAADARREVIALTVSRGTWSERVYAFYRSDGIDTCSFTTQQLRLMRDALLGRPLAAAFVRVSTPVDDQADARLESFLAELTPALAEALR